MRAFTKNIMNRESGFTIVEFMIATSVFSVILLVVTGAILMMTQKYQHSLYSSATQAAASNLVDTIAQSIKFSSGQVGVQGPDASGTMSICIGNRQFLYLPRKQLDGPVVQTATKNAVMTRQQTGASCLMESIDGSTNPSGSPKELLGRNMRLSHLSIRETSPSLWTISASVVYGDDDLLCSSGVAGSCDIPDPLDQQHILDTSINPATGRSTKPLQCKITSGSQFCKVSELSTTVYKRL